MTSPTNPAGASMTIGQFYERCIVSLEKKSLNSTHGRPLRLYAEAFGAVALDAHLKLDAESFVTRYGDLAVAGGHSRNYAEEHAACRASLVLPPGTRRTPHHLGPDRTAATARPPGLGPEAVALRRAARIDARRDGHRARTGDRHSRAARQFRETGSRIIFPISATYADVDHSMRALWVYGKRNHNGLVPISGGLLDALVEHHHAYAERPGDPTTPLILKPNGKGITGRKFDSLFSRIHKYAPWSANPAITAHWLRHTTLQELDFVAPRKVVAAYAGHRPKKAIEVYARVPFGYLREAHDELFDDEGNTRPEQQRDFDAKMTGLTT